MIQLSRCQRSHLKIARLSVFQLKTASGSALMTTGQPACSFKTAQPLMSPVQLASQAAPLAKEQQVIFLLTLISLPPLYFCI
jgi:hypothetical protein